MHGLVVNFGLQHEKNGKKNEVRKWQGLGHGELRHVRSSTFFISWKQNSKALH